MSFSDRFLANLNAIGEGESGVRQDPTESVRRGLIELGIPAEDLAAVVASGGQTWTTAQLTAEFDVQGFMAPYVVVRRKSDGARGSLEFTHSPRFYFGWKTLS